MQIECVLFDFDGVIADTEPHVLEYLARAFAVQGVTIAQQDLLELVGTSGGVWIGRMLAKYNLPFTVEEFQQQRRRLGNYYEDGEALAPMPGVVQLLTQLRAAGIKTGLVSSTSSRLILAALNRMGMTQLFQAIVCGDMVARMKPEPECYQKAMGFLSAAPGQCLVFEDSPVGIQAALAAGATVVGFKGGQLAQNTAAAHWQLNSFEAAASLAPLAQVLGR